MQLGLKFFALGGNSNSVDFNMFWSNWIWLFPVKGVLPVTSWNRMAPTLQRSAFASYFWSCIISGAMYNGEPQSVSARPLGCKDLANPKSAIFKVERSSFEDKRRFCRIETKGTSQWIGHFHQHYHSKPQKNLKALLSTNKWNITKDMQELTPRKPNNFSSLN